MVALLTRLQLKLTLRSFRGNTAKVVGFVFLGLYLAAVLLGMLAGAIALRVADDAGLTGAVTVLGFGFVTFLWPVLMVLLGYNDALAPSRFALLPVSARELRPGLAAASLLTVGGIVTFVLGLEYLVAWSGSVFTFAIAVIGLVLGLSLAVVATRALVAALSATLASRRFRDLVVVIVGLFAMLLAFSGQLFGFFAQEGGTVGRPELVSAGGLIGWTPFGWAWSLPWDAAEGRWWMVVVKALATIACVVALWWAWGRSLARALTSPLEVRGADTKIKDSSRYDALMPNSAAGAIGARTLRYWVRDPRRRIQAISILILPVVFTITMMSGGGPGAPEAYLLVPIGSMAIVAMTLVATEISYDGSALAEQIVSGATGRDDRLGRLYGVGLLFGPFSLVLLLGYIIATRTWGMSFVAMAAMIGVLGVSAGVGSFVGAVWNYPVPPVSAGMTSRGNLSAVLGIMLGFVITSVLLVPVLGMAVWAYWSPTLAWVSPLVSIALGAGVCWVGVWLGGRVLDRTWPDVLRRVTWTG